MRMARGEITQTSLIMDDVPSSPLQTLQNGTDVRAEELSFDDHRSVRQLAYQEGKGG